MVLKDDTRHRILPLVINYLFVQKKRKKNHPKTAFAYDHVDKKGKRHQGADHAQVPVEVASISVSLWAHSSGLRLQMLAHPSLGSRAGHPRL